LSSGFLSWLSSDVQGSPKFCKSKAAWKIGEDSRRAGIFHICYQRWVGRNGPKTPLHGVFIIIFAVSELLPTRV
jgi:hypothetical protein